MDIHFLLEQLPLQKITEGFVQKYPEVNVQMAHNALLYFEDFNKKEKINFLGKGISLKEMESRLTAAVANTSQFFKPDHTKTLLPKNIKPIPKKLQKESTAKNRDCCSNKLLICDSKILVVKEKIEVYEKANEFGSQTD